MEETKISACVLSWPGQYHDSQGLLDILSYSKKENIIDFENIFHVHTYKDFQHPENIIQEKMPERYGQKGHIDRLHHGAYLLEESGADYGLFIEAHVWPLVPKALYYFYKEMYKENYFLAAAAMEADLKDDFVPKGGIWPRLFLMDLNWSRKRNFFPLPWDKWIESSFTRAAYWQDPSLAWCLSAHYFRKIEEAVNNLESMRGSQNRFLTVSRQEAQKHLLRLKELEPISRHSQEEFLWRKLAVVQGDPKLKQKICKEINVSSWGPTLHKLQTSQDLEWFNQT